MNADDFVEMSGSKKWHAVYVHIHHERRIQSEIASMGIETFLPMKRELHTWSDRKKWIDVPLFESYVFVKVTPSERDRVFCIKGYLRYVCIGGKPSVIPQGQIDQIRRIVVSYPESVGLSKLDYVGTEGVIIAGPLKGLRGKIVANMNQKYFTVKVDGIEKVMVVKIPVFLFQPLAEAGKYEQHENVLSGTETGLDIEHFCVQNS